MSNANMLSFIRQRLGKFGISTPPTVAGGAVHFDQTDEVSR